MERLIHSFQKVLAQEWFRQKNSSLSNESLGQRDLGVSGNVEYLGFRMERLDLHYDRRPIHVGQYNIADDQRNRFSILRGHVESRVTAAGLQHIVAARGEKLT